MRHIESLDDVSPTSIDFVMTMDEDTELVEKLSTYAPPVVEDTPLKLEQIHIYQSAFYGTYWGTCIPIGCTTALHDCDGDHHLHTVDRRPREYAILIAPYSDVFETFRHEVAHAWDFHERLCSAEFGRPIERKFDALDAPHSHAYDR